VDAKVTLAILDHLSEIQALILIMESNHRIIHIITVYPMEICIRLLNLIGKPLPHQNGRKIAHQKLL
jgi:hypothetical protein